MLENLAVPELELPATGGKTFKLSEQRGRPLVLYFYPKDNTPGCTDEGAQFRDLYAERHANAHGLLQVQLRAPCAKLFDARAQRAGGHGRPDWDRSHQVLLRARHPGRGC